MHDHNPFAPPSATAEPLGGRGLVFSEEGVRVVSSLASWMRGLSTFYYVGLGLMILGLSCTVVSAARGTGLAVGIFLVVSVWLGVVATWLRSAASGFERGVMSDDEGTLGQGFRSLRAYLILMGIFSIISFGTTIFNASM